VRAACDAERTWDPNPKFSLAAPTPASSKRGSGLIVFSSGDITASRPQVTTQLSHGIGYSSAAGLWDVVQQAEFADVAGRSSAAAHGAPAHHR
jgi:hypothetical protein